MKIEDLKTLGFEENSGGFVFQRHNCIISVDKNLEVAYDKNITIGRNTIKDLKKAENAVVLECVISLIELGYKAENLILEKKFPLGHSQGWLDIEIVDNNFKPWALIEVKTPGKEFNNAKENSIGPKGEVDNQLLTYYLQEKSAHLFGFYTSSISQGKRIRNFDYVLPNKDMKNASNLSELYNSWDKSFYSKGIFDKDSTPFDSTAQTKRYEDLRNLGESESNFIFHQLKEILRRNVVSDESNSFNKIFNLIICKIYDEDTKDGSNSPLEFQWKTTDSLENLENRLLELYKKGLKVYLNIEGKYAGRNDFAFIEVLDEASYQKNLGILREVVMLMESYKFKYNHKQQYLGDFFEDLLDTGYRQSRGQFFTPVPLTSFICNSLPIKKIIERKNEDGEIDFLPYAIDYASGSGHFITEIISVINKKIEEFDESRIKGGKTARDKFKQTKNNFAWCSEYIYAIENDYRLAKTTKVSSFLNGDGDANTIAADGLAPFDDNNYIGKLRNQDSKNFNGNFDIIVSNPPYSVDAFKANLNKEAKNTFSIYDQATSSSKEIEAFFVERASQLLTEGGIAALILPASFLKPSNKLHEGAMKILHEKFHLYGLVNLGTLAFSETTMRTVIVFLKKKVNKENIQKKPVIICDLDVESKVQPHLLGYKPTKRIENKGLITYPENILFEELNPQSEEHLSFYIKKHLEDEDISSNFKDTKLKIDCDLKKYIRLVSLESIIEDKININIFPKKDLLKFKEPLIHLNSLLKPYTVSKNGDETNIITGWRPKGDSNIHKDGVLSISGQQFEEKYGGELHFNKPTFLPVEVVLDYIQKNQDLNKQKYIQKNDILMVKDGADTGRTCFVKELDFSVESKSFNVALANNHTYILRANKETDPFYLFIFLYSSFFTKEILPTILTRGGQGGVNATNLKNCKIPFPDINIQKQIVEETYEKFYELNSVKRREYVDKVLGDYLV